MPKIQESCSESRAAHLSMLSLLLEASQRTSKFSDVQRRNKAYPSSQFFAPFFWCIFT